MVHRCENKVKLIMINKTLLEKIETLLEITGPLINNKNKNV